MNVPITALFQKAYGLYGLGAFNVFNAEQIWGVFNGAHKSNRPIIIQITPVALNYLPFQVLKSCIHSQSQLLPNVDFAVHLDHGNFQACEFAVNSGFFNSIMIDASHENFSENIKITREVVAMAHAKNIAVEAELGVLSGVEDDMNVQEESAFYTDPEQVKEFIKLTGCDSLAVAVGTSHGAYKFSNQQGLQLDILAKISALVPRFPLVLHGASGVPVNEIERINLSGGLLKTDSGGLKTTDLLNAIKLGVCKVNIATDMRLIWTRVHREFFNTSPEKFDFVIPGKVYMAALEDFVEKKCNELALNY